MFTQKRMSNSPLNASRLSRSHSLKVQNDPSQPNLNTSIGLNRISHNLGLIYNDSILQSYKSPLPIKVNEIIAKLKSQENAHISVTMLPNGHVCFSYDKKLLVWKLKKSLKTLQCFELSLPQNRSAQAIKPNCVSVENFNNKEYVGLVVTSDCTVRYWQSILNEYLCIDVKYDLPANEHVANLTVLAENHYLIITTNGNLISCNIEASDEKVMPVLRKIDTSSRLASVGRRMTSLIFGGSGAGSQSTLLNKNFQNFKAALRYNQSYDLYILVEKNLQKFKINTDMSLTLVSQSNVEKLIHEDYLVKMPDSYRASVFLHDAAITKNSVYVLALVEDNGYKFVIAEIDTTVTNTEVKKLKSLHILNYNLQNTDIHQTQYRLKAMDNQYALYVYSTNLVLSFTGPTFDFSGESKFNTLGDKLVSAEFYDSDLLYFSLNHGILKTKDNSLRLNIEDESFMSKTTAETSNLNFSISQHNNTAMAGNISLLGGGHNDSTDDMSFNKTAKLHAFDLTFTNVNVSDQSILIRLKEAFQLFLRKDERETQALVDEIFKLSSMDKKIDFLCVEFSEKLIDDMPSHDPRWAELNPKGKSFNSNLIISNQLKGKVRFHEYFLTFLKQFKIWENLSVINYNGRDISTVLALEEHGEKLQCALILREQLNAKNPELINAAIEFIAKSREEMNTKLIYPHDIFYRKVSKIQEVFNALYYIENEVIKVNSNEQAFAYLTDTTMFLSKLLKTSQQYYKDKKRFYENSEHLDEYVRWTFLPTKDVPSLIAICTRQHKLCSDYGLPNCVTLENKSTLLENLYELDCLIFEEYELRLRTISSTDENNYINLKMDYDSLKTKLIDTYVKNKQIDTAMKLAEKYVDFNILVSICENKNNHQLLENYLDKFAQTDFADFVIRYFMERKKLNFLLKNNFLKRADLSSCFDKYKFLSWIKDIKNDRFKESALTLNNLGYEEKESFMKKRSLISMSKLNLIANAGFENLNANDTKLMNSLNRQLSYLAYFDNLPQSTLKNLGLNAEEIPCYKPERLIELLINDEEASEIEFRKALELLEYLNDDNENYSDMHIESFKVEILVKSILADNWEKLYYEDYPETKLDKTKFFKSILSLRDSGKSLEEFAQLKEPLLRHELTEHLANNPRFSFLLETCFEMLEC